MCSNQLNFSPCFINLEGFYLFACFDAWISPPNKPASLSGQERLTRTTAVPWQQCNQRAAALQASLRLLACSMADALREESHPLSYLISHTSPLLLIEPVCTVLKGTASIPELSRVWSPVPSRDWIFAGFLLFCFFLSQVLSTDSAWAKYCGLIRSSSEPGVHLPAANYSQNKTKLWGQLPQSLLCLPFNRCPISTARPFLMFSFLFSHLPLNRLVLKVHQLCLLICIW